ncbi:MAG: DNA-directed RNA polymerase subunit delta [Flavobacteriales bacterium]
MSKKRVVKDYEKLTVDIINQIKLTYPDGFVENLIKYDNAQGKRVSALPFETDDMYYLIRMTADEAEQIIEEDGDYEDGVLRDDFEEETEKVEELETEDED